jgi:hypothetical protein
MFSARDIEYPKMHDVPESFVKFEGFLKIRYLMRRTIYLLVDLFIFGQNFSSNKRSFDSLVYTVL